MKLRLLLLSALTATSLHAGAQGALDFGEVLPHDPANDVPYIYYDLLRSQQPFIVWQYRTSLTSNKWIRESKYVTEKQGARFSNLHSLVWDSTLKVWEPARKYDYTFVYQGNNLVKRTTNMLFNGGTSITTIQDSLVYDANNRVIVEVVERKQPAYQLIATKYYDYDSQGRMLRDSSVYATDNSVTYYSYAGNKINAAYKALADTISLREVTTDANGKTVEILEYQYAAGVRDAVWQDSFTYDGAGRIANFIRYTSATPLIADREASEKIEHSYLPDGRLAEWVRSLGDPGTLNWDIDYQLKMQYNSAGKADTGFAYGETAGIFDEEPFALFLFSDEATSVKNVAAAKATYIYPNPATNVLHTGVAAGNAATIRITDISGKLVMTGSSQSGQVDVSALQPGMYFISVNKAPAASFSKL